MRKYVEETMSSAVVRVCYNCGKEFFKVAGCNRVVCQCGADMCYYCKKPFAQCEQLDSCLPLGSDEERHRDDVELARINAIDDYIKRFPEAIRYKDGLSADTFSILERQRQELDFYIENLFEVDEFDDEDDDDNNYNSNNNTKNSLCSVENVFGNDMIGNTNGKTACTQRTSKSEESTAGKRKCSAAGRQNNNNKSQQPHSLPMNASQSPRGSGYPLRILVPSKYVGAIIGRKGQTIRNITTRCKARVDVHGKENSGLIEKVISIYSQPENCTNACKEILQVIQQESTSNNRGEVMLKMLCDDRYCGRIIGKEGKMIKKIREDTSTKITVSNAQEMAALFPDRVIAIHGGIDNISQAEAAISAKLAECIEHEMQQGVGMPPGMMMSPMMCGGMNAGGFYSNPYEAQNYYAAPMYGAGPAGPQQPGIMGPAHVSESLQICVPNAAVGAIIGAAGSNIKQMMRESSAFVNIETKKDADPSVDRVVTIKGGPEACWRASYLVFKKLKVEGFAGNDDVRLKTSLRIPKAAVGRIIGKGGKNVRELQRVTGAIVKLPEDPTTQGDEVIVEVYGSFMSIQGAHSRIRAMANQTQQQLNYNGPTQQQRAGPLRRSAPPQDAHQ